MARIDYFDDPNAPTPNSIVPAAVGCVVDDQGRLLLEHRVDKPTDDYLESGNVLLDHLHGATTEKRPGGADMNAELEAAADRLRAEGEVVYTIPGGGSNPTGALGYVNCAFEMLGQFNDRGLRVDHIVHATGSAGTQAGLVTGRGIHVDDQMITSDAVIFALGECVEHDGNIFGLVAPLELAQKQGLLHVSVDELRLELDEIRAHHRRRELYV